MDSTETSVLVLRGGAPGLPVEGYYNALLEQLQDYKVQLAKTPKQEREMIKTATILTGNGVTQQLVEEADNLRLYAHAGIGTDGLPMEAFAERGVAVTNAAGLMPQVAEQAAAYILHFARCLHVGWERNRTPEWRHYQPYSVAGSTVTIVGLGSIGRQLTRRLQGFDVETIGVRYTPSKGGPTDTVIGYEEDDFHEALAETDYLVLACPLSETTRQLIGSEELQTLSVDSVLINVARGEVVETDALTTALRRGMIRAAALDVTDPEPLPETHPLWNLSNVLITPHNAGNIAEHWTHVAELLVENLERAEESGSYTELRNQVIEAR